MEGEAGSASGLVVQAHGAGVTAHDVAHDVKTEAVAPFSPGGEEGFKNAVGQFGVDAGAGIGDFDTVAGNGKAQDATLLHGLTRVEHEIGEDAVDGFRVGEDVWHRCRSTEEEAHAIGQAQASGKFTNQSYGVDWCQFQGSASADLQQVRRELGTAHDDFHGCARVTGGKMVHNKCELIIQVVRDTSRGGTDGGIACGIACGIA